MSEPGGSEFLSDDLRALYDIRVTDYDPEGPRDDLVIFVHLTPYVNNEDHVEYIDVREQDKYFAEAANAMADECDLYHYRGMLYNMPPGVIKPLPPYHCVIRGRYIGVFESRCW